MLEEIVRVGKKNVVVIPSRVRKKVGIKEGDLLELKVEGDRILLERLSSEPFRVLAEVIGEQYREEVDEAKAERTLKGLVECP